MIKGVKRYDKNRWTAILTDKVKCDLGYVMSQKECKTITPICCMDVWQVCKIGSSLFSPAESNYARVEEE